MRFCPLSSWQLPGAMLFISSCQFAPSVRHWLLPWFSCPGSWPGLWGRWGCWWGRQGTGRSGTPAGLSLAPGRLDGALVLAGARCALLIGAVSSTNRCGSWCRQAARPSVCLHHFWQEGDCSSGSGHTRAAAEPGRNTHAHTAWLGLCLQGEKSRSASGSKLHNCDAARLLSAMACIRNFFICSNETSEAIWNESFSISLISSLFSNPISLMKWGRWCK